MKSPADLSHVAPRGWPARYAGLRREFGISEARDRAAARLLDSALADPAPLSELRAALGGRAAFVAGAGPSLGDALPHIGRFPRAAVVAADSALGALLGAGVRPDVVVTDLDGDPAALRAAGRAGALMVVHAHADNAGALPAAAGLGRCLGTSQCAPVGRLHNFGGFTDGDRCAFAAEAAGASSIVLFGMDLGGPVGPLSGTAPADEGAKLRKLRAAGRLLGWLAGWARAGLYTASGPVPGFGRVGYGGLGRVAGA